MSLSYPQNCAVFSKDHLWDPGFQAAWIYVNISETYKRGCGLRSTTESASRPTEITVIDEVDESKIVSLGG